MITLFIVIYVVSVIVFLVEAGVIAARSTSVSLGYVVATVMIALLPVLNTVCAILFAVELDSVKFVKAKKDE